jgi:hypothetical protein
MSYVIVNPAWKSKKEGFVTYKGEEYEIGSDAFGSVADAVKAGATSDLVIVDKNLSSPVNKTDVESASIDIFASTVKETESADGKTTTTAVKFSAASGGSATMKNNSELTGFDKVTVTKVDGANKFEGGKIDFTANTKLVDDSDKGIETVDITASLASTATGTLNVTGKSSTAHAEVTVAGIEDSEDEFEDALEDTIGVAYEAIKDEDYEIKSFNTYANVTLKFVDSTSNFNGGTTTEKAVVKTSNTNDEKKITETYTYSLAEKVGTGTASLTDAGAGGISGFKTVKITASSAPITVGELNAESQTKDYSVKTSFVAEKSSDYDYSEKKTENVSGTATVSGKNSTNTVTVDDDIEGFSSISLKNAVVAGYIDSESESSTEALKISVKAQKENASLTATYNKTSTSAVNGALTAASTTFFSNSDPDEESKGLKTVSIKDSKFSADSAAVSKFSGTVSKEKVTRKITGIADGDISPDQQSDYADVFKADPWDLIDKEEAYSYDWTVKIDESVGGTSFQVSGTTGADSWISVSDFKSVSLENKSKTATLYASLSNHEGTVVGMMGALDYTWKESFTPDKSYSYSFNQQAASKAVGDATIKGKVTADVSGFASVKTEDANTTLTGFSGASTYSSKYSTSQTVKPGKDAPLANESYTSTSSSKAASTLTASKATLTGGFNNLKSVKLKDVDVTGSARFSGAVDSDIKSSSKVDWIAEAIDDKQTYSGDYYKEEVTSVTRSNDDKSTIVADFSLNNTKFAWTGQTGLAVNNFKTADITIASATAVINGVEFVNAGNSATKFSQKRTVAATKRSQDYKDETTTTAVGTLKITGKSDKTNTTTLQAKDVANIGYSSISLNDAVITGTGLTASSYANSESLSISENATLDSGDVVATTLKVSRTRSSTGNGSFSAESARAITAFSGTLYGYSISLKNDVSIGDVSNYKTTGYGYDAPYFYVPWEGEYFDVVEGNMTGSAPTGDGVLFGNISGSYTLDKTGKVEAKWTGSQAQTAAGSFSQTARTEDGSVLAGNITGYDKVSLSHVTAKDIDGENSSNTIELTYKTTKDGDVIADSSVLTVKKTSASSVTLAGKKDAATASATSINGYEKVELKGARVTGTITAVNTTTVTTTDKVDSEVVLKNESSTAVGSLSADKVSSLGGDVSGFQKVTLTDAAANVNFSGGNTSYAYNLTEDKYIAQENTAAGEFKAESSDDKKTLGAISGFQKVSVTDYNAGNVTAFNAVPVPVVTASGTSYKVIAANEDKEIPETVELEGAVKSNTFSATAKKNEKMAVGNVTGYGSSVKAEKLDSIGDISVSAFVMDDVDGSAFTDARFYTNTHYGNFSATYDNEESAFTAINAAATGTATVTGTSSLSTKMGGDVIGYDSVTLKYVAVGDDSPSTFAGGKYTYTTKTNKDEEVIATSTSTASGKLSISSATAGLGGFAVIGFKDVDVTFGSAATFTSIIGGTEAAQFTDGGFDYNTFTLGGSLKLTTAAGSVTGTVAGFEKIELTDTAFSGSIAGYNLKATENDGAWEQYYETKAKVTFDNTTDATTAVAGSIRSADKIVFKSAGDGVDFAITSAISSIDVNAKGKNIDTEIEIDGSQVTMDFSQLTLDEGDTIKLSGTGAEINLGDIATVEDLEAMIADMGYVEIKGAGNIAFSTIGEQDFANTLDAANIKWGLQVTFNGDHYDPKKA